jgi:hypothetical protein
MDKARCFKMALAATVLVMVIDTTASVHADPLSPTFTYQGQLRQGGSAVNETCDFQFSLWDTAGSGSPPTGASQVGSLQPAAGVLVSEGLFTVVLGFGSDAFKGDERWLQILVRCPDGSGPYTTLAPRQQLSASPYALYAPSAGSASDLSCNGCIASTELASGAVTSSQIANGTIQKSNLAFTPGSVTQVTAGLGLTGGTITATGTIAADIGTTPGTVAEGNHTHDASYWKLGGNTGTSPGPHFVGTSDNQPLELHVNGQRALRLEPGDSPNVVGGYSGNAVTPGAMAATICGGGESGNVNRVTDYRGTVCGGRDNQAGDGGGSVVDSQLATVGGGGGNTAAGWGDTISGGANNKSEGSFSAIGGGTENSVSGFYAAVGGGFGNRAEAAYATIGGGGRANFSDPDTANRVTDNYGTVAGGQNNQAGDADMNQGDAFGATVGGGGGNTASAQGATVGGGGGNQATALYATVAGGVFNSATADHATVPGGSGNLASGAGSFAAGRLAAATHNGSFVWGDGTRIAGSQGANTFNVLATGGIRLYYDAAGSHCDLTSITDNWDCTHVTTSDRAAKDRFGTTDGRDVLTRLAAIPIETWAYKTQDPPVRHIGPMAQDFYAAFNVGGDDTHINTIDANGVALAAIQGLYQMMQQKDAEITALKARLAALEQAVSRPAGGPLRERHATRAGGDGR